MALFVFMRSGEVASKTPVVVITGLLAHAITTENNGELVCASNEYKITLSFPQHGKRKLVNECCIQAMLSGQARENCWGLWSSGFMGGVG